MGINLDNQQEAEYLAELASALGLGSLHIVVTQLSSPLSLGH